MNENCEPRTRTHPIMKPKLTPALAMVAFSMVAQAPAFTLNFAMLAIGAPVPGSPGHLQLTVPGYGEVQLQSATGSGLEVAAFGTVTGIRFDGGETLKVNFMAGPLVGSPFFDKAELDDGEFFSVSETVPGSYEVSFTGTSGGITGANFIPEASSMLSGALGTLLLLHRRRPAASV
jgi:hypothetical protein